MNNFFPLNAMIRTIEQLSVAIGGLLWEGVSQTELSSTKTLAQKKSNPRVALLIRRRA
jgi:hypothetical protein